MHMQVNRCATVCAHVSVRFQVFQCDLEFLTFKIRIATFFLVSVLKDIFENVQIGPRASAVALVRTVQQKEREILAIDDQGL
jgi:hypothetical protein